MGRVAISALIAGFALLAGCVTNNINFDGQHGGMSMTPGSLVKGLLPGVRCL